MVNVAFGRAAVAELMRGSRVAPRETVADLIARVSPHLENPVHLAPITDILESAQVQPFEAVTATPPRHAKPTTSLHDIILLLERDPTYKIAYVTYAAEMTLDAVMGYAQTAAPTGGPS